MKISILTTPLVIKLISVLNNYNINNYKFLVVEVVVMWIVWKTYEMLCLCIIRILISIWKALHNKIIKC